MGKNKKTKTYNIDGIDYSFYFKEFCDRFKQTQKELECKVGELEQKIADTIPVSKSSVHSWRFYKNSPNDIEIIKKIAKIFDTDYEKLLIKDGEKIMISERQINSLKRIYDSIIDFLDLFYYSDGFNEYYLIIKKKYEKKGTYLNNKQIEDKIYEIADKALRKVDLILKKEYIILSHYDIYYKLKEYVDYTLSDIYDEKVYYSCRFEASVEDINGNRTTPTTYEDYSNALKVINEMLEPYFKESK